jgi:hypothetical protein
MRTIVKRGWLGVEYPQISLVQDPRGLQCMVTTFPAHLPRRDSVEVAVDQRGKFICRRRIAEPPPVEKTRHIARFVPFRHIDSIYYELFSSRSALSSPEREKI